MNVPVLAPAVNKRLSRSNSTSSSVSTVKYIGAKIGHRSSHSTTRPTSSDSINQHFSTLDAAAKESIARTQDSIDDPRSRNRIVGEWSHSASSSMGAVEKDVLRQVPSNSIAARAAKFESPRKPAPTLKSQYSIRQSGDPVLAGPSHSRSPSRRPRSTPKGSPERSRQSEPIGHFTPLQTTPELDANASRTSQNEYFGTTVLEHSRGANKFGQTFEGVALITAGQPRPKRSELNKSGSSLHDASNSSHISTQKGHSHARRREHAENESRDTPPGGSVSSLRSEHTRKPSQRSPMQKNMLSKALAKANQAVLLDNAQDIQGAIRAYVEACDILEEVMLKSSDNEDRKKLSAIRNTYSSRIADLYDIDKSFEHLQIDKELPEAPTTTRYLEGQDRVSFEDPEDEDVPPSILVNGDNEPQRMIHIPLRQESLLPQIFGGEKYLEQQQPPSRHIVPPLTGLNVPMDSKYMPPPLSPRRPSSPTQNEQQFVPSPALQAQQPMQQRRLSTGSTSWLDTVDDNGSSIPSSRLSSIDYGQQGNTLVSAIEAELNAAVDEAYEEDLREEPTPTVGEAEFYEDHELLAGAEGAHYLANQPSQDSMASDADFDNASGDYYDEDLEATQIAEAVEAAQAADAAEEEELLDMMMADGYAFDDQKQQAGTMSSLPRQSDSSGFSVRSSGRTWESSLTTATNGTALSTLAESPEVAQHEASDQTKDMDEDTLPPNEPETTSTIQPHTLTRERSMDKPGLRDRRMSGQSAKQLKIETFTRRPSISQQGQPNEPPLLEIPSTQSEQPEISLSASATNLNGMLPPTPLASVHSMESADSPITPGLTQILSNSSIGADPTKLTHARKNLSSSTSRPTDLSVTTSDLNDLPPTPGSAIFTSHSRQGTSITTPAFPNASPNVLSSTAVGGMYIFDHIADPVSPGGSRSPDSQRAEPLPLEPCPEAFLLRPFWLMRCLYQSMAHPKGGYISTKLFLPRDIWRVKGVKIKGIEDKIGQCDVLTAALLKLAKVDTLDAAACCEELQSFETIIEAAKFQLQKKLGGDVGLTGSMVAMRASPAEDPEVSSTKTTSSMKSFTNSLRKLRTKSSTAGLTPTLGTGIRRETSNDISMPSLPMTASSAVRTSRSYRNQRYPPPTPTGLPFIPAQHANYMSSLARLFDAVQVLDSIARQVEDPGLKATSPSHVGLELSIRGAAEFFSFYILRFVLADIGVMLDKYLKRNSEWILT